MNLEDGLEVLFEKSSFKKIPFEAFIKKPPFSSPLEAPSEAPLDAPSKAWKTP